MPDPTSRAIVTELYAERLRQFFSRYGSFLQLWQTFELMIEIVLMRELRLTPLETSSIFNSLNYSAKASAALAMLSRNSKNKPAIDALRAAQKTAERNDFTHSFIVHGSDGSITFIRRTTKDGKYTVDKRSTNVTLMEQHGREFANSFERAAKALKITNEEISAYTREIQSHAQA